MLGRRTLLLLLLVFAAAIETTAQQKTPDLSFKDIYGKTIRLSDFHGKVLLLNFWAALLSTLKSKRRAVLSILLAKLWAPSPVIRPGIPQPVQSSCGAAQDVSCVSNCPHGTQPNPADCGAVIAGFFLQIKQNV